MSYENISYEIKENFYGVLTVNRPKALNALNPKVLDEIEDLLKKEGQNKNLKCLILTGGGEKAFIAGADIAALGPMSKEDALIFAQKGQNVSRLLENFFTPVIAAVNGFALGGGCEMAISCDFIIATQNAVFGQPEVGLGIITGFGGGVRLAEFVGWPRARELLFSGRKINAEEALRVGLVNKVVTKETLMDETMKIAKEIGAQSPYAVRKLKRVTTEVRSEASTSEKLYIEAKAFSEVFGTFDQKEGVAAFLEKRKPQFKGE